MSTADERPDYRPSITNPQCKVCTSEHRLEIEVALAQGQPQERVARRFSRGAQKFSKQNIHTHYHKHMQVIEKAVAEAAAAEGRDLMLDLKTATEIEAQNARTRARMRAQVSATIENGDLDWRRPRDVMAFMEFDARLGEQEAAARAELVMIQARTFGTAVREVVTDNDVHVKILETYDRIYDEQYKRWDRSILEEDGEGEEPDPQV